MARVFVLISLFFLNLNLKAQIIDTSSWKKVDSVIIDYLEAYAKQRNRNMRVYPDSVYLNLLFTEGQSVYRKRCLYGVFNRRYFSFDVCPVKYDSKNDCYLVRIEVSQHVKKNFYIIKGTINFKVVIHPQIEVKEIRNPNLLI